MKILILAFTLALLPATAQAADTRELVQLPDPMQEHLLQNMRNHLEVINRLLDMLGRESWDEAAFLAESELGMSSLDKHGAKHIAGFYPDPMQAIGTDMHRAASRFARTVSEGDLLAATRALGEVTNACTRCHAAYRIR